MKIKGWVVVSFLVGVIAGSIGMNFWKDAGMKELSSLEPEGYSTEEILSERAPGEVMVKNLDIAENVHKYNDVIDLVAIAPGSGWLRFKTRDELTPVINFFKVTEKDVTGVQ